MVGDELQIRPAGAADVAAIVALVTAAYRGESSRAGWTTEADLLEGSRIDAALLMADLVAERSEVVVAESSGASGAGGALVACVHIKAVADRPGRGYLGMFAVAPTSQGTGIGSRVMAAAEARAAQAWGVSEMELTVIEQRTELIAYYERRGYQQTGDVVAFPYGDERFGTPLRDDLQMRVLRKKL